MIEFWFWCWIMRKKNDSFNWTNHWTISFSETLLLESELNKSPSGLVKPFHTRGTERFRLGFPRTIPLTRSGSNSGACSRFSRSHLFTNALTWYHYNVIRRNDRCIVIVQEQTCHVTRGHVYGQTCIQI